MLGFLHCEVLKVENNREAKYPPLILENLKPLRKKNSSATEDDTPDKEKTKILSCFFLFIPYVSKRRKCFFL